MSEPATLIILAGGRSRRMGYPKCYLPTPSGETLVEHLARRLRPLFSEVIGVGRDPLELAGIHWTADRYPIQSPLVGIEAGLAASRHDLTLVVACDMPFVVPQLVRYLLAEAGDVEAVVPVVNDYYEPLLAVYRARILPVVRAHIEAGDLKVANIYRDIDIKTVSEAELRRAAPDLKSFINLNTVRDLVLLRRL